MPMSERYLLVDKRGDPILTDNLDYAKYLCAGSFGRYCLIDLVDGVELVLHSKSIDKYPIKKGPP